MRPSLIIPHLRAACPSFSNRIGGAVDFEGAQLAEELQMPCAFVIPIATTPAENQLIGGVAQDVVETFSVAICTSNVADERGQDSVETMHDLIDEISAALVAWSPAANCGPIEWAGVEFTAPDRAKLWATTTYSTQTYATT